VKGVDALIASVLILIISITAIFLALQLGGQSTQRTKEVLLMQEGKNTLSSIDNAIKNVLTEGEGSVRVLRFSISGGNYKIDNATNSVTFSMDSKSQIIAEGVSKIEDGINFTGETGTVYLNLSYDIIKIIGAEEFGRGYHTLTIRNNGYNSTTQEQMIYISSVPLAPPTVLTFTDQYNQTQTLNITGKNTTSPINLNDFGINTYNITESLESGGQHNYSQNNTTNITGINTTSADYTNSLDGANYNVTSSFGQTVGTFINNYNQSQTIVVVGANSTSPSNLNMVDGQTYNVAEAIVTSETIALYNWTSPNQQVGTQRFTNTTSPTSNTYNTGWVNGTATYVVAGSAWTNPTNVYTANNIYAQQNANRVNVLGLNITNSIPSGATILGIGIATRANASSASGTNQIYFEVSNDTGTTWSKTSTTTGDMGTTNTYRYYGSTSNLWGLTWNGVNGANNLRISANGSDSSTSYYVRLDWLAANVTYGNYTPVKEQNSSWTSPYSGIDGSNCQNVDKVGAIITISSYNPSASNTTYDNNNRPDIEVGFYNGATYVNGTYCNINKTMGNNLLNTTVWNCMVNITNSDILNAWKYSTNRSVIIRGIWLDAYSSTIYDEVNVTGIYGYVDGWNNTPATYRSEVEHNATGISWSGTLNSINVSLNFSTNVSSTFNFTIYNFNLGSWNYTVCQSGTASAGNWYNWWCNITSNPTYYNSSDGKIRIRLNETGHSGLAVIREDYVQYYVTNTISTTYANVSVEHNSSTISEDPLLITKINVTTVLKTNVSSGIIFNLYIYNFSSDSWFPCFQSSINNSYSKMECVITNNSPYYISNGKIIIRLNSSVDVSHQMMEDYLIYQTTLPSMYRMEVEHNATGISWSGTLNSINVSLNFSTNVSSTFNFTIYNFNSGVWNYAVCQSGTASAGNWYNWWCNITSNPTYYNSSSGVIRVRLNETSHQSLAEVKEDYVQYYVTYAQ
jgi:hypothetical protein